MPRIIIEVVRIHPTYRFETFIEGSKSIDNIRLYLLNNSVHMNYHTHNNCLLLIEIFLMKGSVYLKLVRFWWIMILMTLEMTPKVCHQHFFVIGIDARKRWIPFPTNSFLEFFLTVKNWLRFLIFLNYRLSLELLKGSVNVFVLSIGPYFTPIHRIEFTLTESF